MRVVAPARTGFQGSADRHWTGNDERIVGSGPFVMNTPGEIRQAIVDYQNGRMGHLS